MAHATPYICNHVILNNSVPLEKVAEILGYKSVSTMQIYSKILKKKIADDMEKIKK